MLNDQERMQYFSKQLGVDGKYRKIPVILKGVVLMYNIQVQLRKRFRLADTVIMNHYLSI